MQPVCHHMIFYSLQLFTHNLIKDKRIDLIEITFNREDFPYLACNDRIAFLLLKKISCMVLSNVYDALTFLLDYIFYSIWQQVI